jgi:hypothetical protein
MNNIEGMRSGVEKMLEAANMFQRDLVESTAKRKVAVLGRRAGGTFCGAMAAIRACALGSDATTCVYVSPTKSTIEHIVLPVILEIENRFGFGLKYKATNSDVVLPNGSRILLRGATQLQSVMGIEPSAVVVDSAGSYIPSQLRTVVHNASELLFRGDGELIVIGTPPNRDIPLAEEYFYDLSNAWPCWAWNATNNHKIPGFEHEVLRIVKAHGYSFSDPHVRREWLGHWVPPTKGVSTNGTMQGL